MNDKPQGGSELMYSELIRRLPQKYLDEYSIFNYPVNRDETKKLIYWNQLSYDQPIVQAFTDRNFTDTVEKFVFVSHWQFNQFQKYYGVPGIKSEVIQNAHLGVDVRKRQNTSIVKLCYTSTPWRGLDILLKAWDLLRPKNCELHIFSGTKIYGKDFYDSQDALYQKLYEDCQQLEGVVYRGNVDNEQLRKELPDFDILAYPNTFEETSCIAVIEALAAGLRVVTSNLGALPETTEGWARMYPYVHNKDYHAKVFADILSQEIEKIRDGALNDYLTQQATHYNQKWHWDARERDWFNFFSKL